MGHPPALPPGDSVNIGDLAIALPSGGQLTTVNVRTGEDSSDIDISADMSNNIAALAPAMQRGAAFANKATAYTGAAYGVAAGATVAIPAAANAVGYGIGYLEGAYGSGAGVLLGRYWNEAENYMIDAKDMGLNYFNIGDRGWKVLDYLGDAWTANRGFLDASFARGQQFFLNEAPFGNFRFGTYGREIDYLFESGIPNSRIVVTF